MTMQQQWARVVCLMLVYIQISTALNARPIIGVVAQSTKNTDFEDLGDIYLYSSYVKFLQMAGARVVPLLTDQSDEYYEEMFNNLNGVLFPGGGASVEQSGYASVGVKMYNMARQAFDQGDYFPLWGTCDGFELLSAMTAAEYILTHCDSENLTLPLHFSKDFRSSRVFANISDDLVEAATSEPITQNNHQLCLTAKTYNDNSPLKTFYRVISTNVDRNGLEFISMFEGLKYPFYGVQFHPEKSLFNWETTLNVSHSQHAIRFAQYLADFFVQEAKKNDHHFPSSSAEGKALIDNYNPHFIGSPNFHNVYIFNISQGVDIIPDMFPYIEFTKGLCHHLFMLGYTILSLLGVVLLVAWLKGLYVRKHTTTRRCHHHQLPAHTNVLLDAAGPLPAKSPLVM